ncbi:MAG TPA: adenylate/guanylate cyclase domain-containing protein [Stellaceae bacterium]|nr:adenylate/guanylate cyclase domain-containing protein [Stellaceae bacterium]
MTALPRLWRVPPSTERAARRRRDAALGGVALLAMLVFVALHVMAPDVPWLRRLELFALDTRLRLRGPLAPGPEIVLVLIDDDTVARFGRWPLPRRRFADAVDFLAGAGARVIGIDLLFTEPDVPSAGDGGDRALAAAIGRAGTVALPFAFRFDSERAGAVQPYVAGAAFASLRRDPSFEPDALRPTGVLAPIAPLGEAAAALGHVTIAYDVDGAPRYEYPVLPYDLDDYPSMALRVVQLYRRLPWPKVRVELGRGVWLGDHLLATDPSMRLLVNYLGPAGRFPTVSFADVVAGTAPPDLFRDRIVLIGTRITGIPDAVRTPFSAVLPGVERLATVVDSILHDRPLYRPVYAPWLEAAWMIGFALVVALALSRLSIARAALLAALLLSLGLVLGQFVLVRFGIWTAAAVPSLASVMVFTLLAAYRHGLLDLEHRRIRAAFQRYLAPGMVERLARSPQPPQLGGEQRELTVLFCDLRGFSRLSERLEPRILTQLVNAFFALVTEAVLAEGGTIDKYMGDAVMAFWNAPLEQPDHARRACRAALAVRAALDRLNASSAARIPVDCGIGINTGPCIVGNFGSRHRFDYSAVGDAVNVAARLESVTKTLGLGIAIGAATAARVPDLATLPLAPIPLRGRDQSVEVFALIGGETLRQSAAFRGLHERHRLWQEAARAGEGAAAASLLAALAHEAPPDFAPLYRRLAERLDRQ